ncbi:MAG: glycosyltransferase family 2 protein [Gammaproteobacteria bacterium]
MRMTIAIPAYNEQDYLPACLEHVLADVGRCGVADSIEVLVVDNASTDHTSLVAESFPGVRVVRETTKGLTHARQRALTEAHGEILAFVDADTRMPAGWIARVLKTFDADSGVVCVSGPYIYYDSSRFERALIFIYWACLAMPVYWLTRYMAVGGNFAAERDALHTIDGFDLNIAFYGEDTNIARRLAQVGKVKFLMRLRMPTSPRRLHSEGLWTTAFKYVANFLSEVVLKRPVTDTYQDVR